MNRRVKKGEMIAIVINRIDLVTKSFYRRGPGSKKVALAATKEARYSSVRRLLSNQRRDRINNHLPSSKFILLSEFFMYCTTLISSRLLSNSFASALIACDAFLPLWFRLNVVQLQQCLLGRL